MLTRGGGSPGHDLFGGDSELAGLGGDLAIVLLGHRSIDARAVACGQAQVHGAVLAFPPLAVGGGNAVLTGRQGELVGDGLAFFILLAVYAGVGLVAGSAIIALGLGVGIHQAPGRIALVELVGLAIEQPVAQQSLGGGVGFGRLHAVHGTVAAAGSDAVNKVDSIRRDDLDGVGDITLLDLHGLKGCLEGIGGNAVHVCQHGGHFAHLGGDMGSGHRGVGVATLLDGGGRCGSLVCSGCLGGGRSLGFSRRFRRCRGFLRVRRFIGSFPGRGLGFRCGRGFRGSRGLPGVRVLGRSVCISRGILLLDDGRYRLIVGKRLGRDHACQHADTQGGRQNALTLAFCFSHGFSSSL